MIQFSQMLKPVGMFQNFPKSSSSWSLFDLKLTLRFLKWILENLKGFVSLLTKRDTELIRLIWYVNSSYFFHRSIVICRSQLKSALVTRNNWKPCFFLFFFFISWRLITLQYCSGFCHTLKWISHGFTCVPHTDPPSHLPSPPDPSGSSQCTRSERMSHASNLGWWSFSP